MPEFEFTCLSCGGSFFIQHHLGEIVTQPDCSRCGSFDTVRVWKALPTFYRGHGFFVNDYPTKNEWGEEL